VGDIFVRKGKAAVQRLCAFDKKRDRAVANRFSGIDGAVGGSVASAGFA
jgi:hypothetical protein